MPSVATSPVPKPAPVRRRRFLPFLFLIGFLAGLAGPASAMPELRIEPSTVVLDAPGRGVRLTAAWADPAEAVLGPIVWHSSDPSQVSVTPSGVATPLVPDAFAMITASVNTTVPHHVGSSTVMVAQLRPDLVRLPASYLLGGGLSSAPGADSVDLELVVSDNLATRALTVGDKVSFGFKAALTVEQIIPGRGLRTLRGPNLSMTETFSRLRAHVDAAALESVAAHSLAASLGKAGGGGGGGGGGGICGGCDCAVTPSFNLGSALVIELDDAGLSKFSFTVDGLASLDAGGVKFSTSLTCEHQLLKSRILPPLQIGGLALLPQIDIKVGLEFGASVGVQVPIPELGLELPFHFGLEIEPDDHEVPFGVDPPTGYFDEGQFSAIGFTASVSGHLFLEFGVELGLFPPFLFLDELSILEIDVMMNRFTLGREFTWPSQAFLGPAHRDYQGPTISDAATWEIIPVRVEPGQFIEDLFKLLGRPAFSLAFAPIEVGSWPVLSDTTPELTLDQGHLTIGGGLFPDTAHATVEREPWPLPFGSEIIESDSLWRARGSGNYEDLGIDDWTWTPVEGDEDEYHLRAMSVHKLFGDGYPIATKPRRLVVQPLDFVGVAPRPLVFESNLGGSDTQDLLLISRGTAFDYRIEIPDDLAPWLAVTGAATGTLDADETLPVALTATCPSASSGEHGLVHVVDAATGATVLAEVELRCVRYTLTEQIELRGEVDETLSGRIVLDNSVGGENFDYTASPGDFPGTLSPTSDLVPVLAVRSIQASITCGSEPSSDAYEAEVAVDIAGTTLLHPVEILVSCVKASDDDDDNGTTWGDPHLQSHDGHKFDFQAVGQFVLTRGTLADGTIFEVQTRQEAHPNGRAAFNRGVAVVIDAPSGTADHLVWSASELFVGGVLTDLADGASLTLSTDATLERTGRRYRLRLADDETWFSIRRAPSSNPFLDAEIHLATTATAVEGLLGDFDGDPDDDLQLRTGTVLDSETVSFAELYARFAYDAVEGWVIRDAADSLFFPVDGVHPSSLIDTAHPAAPVDLATLDPDLVAWAESICAGLPLVNDEVFLACVLDVALTGDADLALAAFEASAAYSPGELLYAESFDDLSPDEPTPWLTGHLLDLADGNRVLAPSLGWNAAIRPPSMPTAPMMELSFDLIVQAEWVTNHRFRFVDTASHASLITSFATVPGSVQAFPASILDGENYPALTGAIEATPGSPSTTVFRVRLRFPEQVAEAPGFGFGRTAFATPGWYIDNVEIRAIEAP